MPFFRKRDARFPVFDQTCNLELFPKKEGPTFATYPLATLAQLASYTLPPDVNKQTQAMNIYLWAKDEKGIWAFLRMCPTMWNFVLTPKIGSTLYLTWNARFQVLTEPKPLKCVPKKEGPTLEQKLPNMRHMSWLELSYPGSLPPSLARENLSLQLSPTQ